MSTSQVSTGSQYCTVVLPRSTVRELDGMAERSLRSRSNLVRLAIEQYLRTGRLVEVDVVQPGGET
jgi:metal-responsive CopG/Arc/MetJ family transcriptional regulator